MGCLPPTSLVVCIRMTDTPTASVPETDLSGRQLGDYQVLRRLGRGGMADVYLAEQASLRRQVALKVLKKSLAADEAYVRRFRNEAQAAAALSHANIVQIYEVGYVDGIHFIAQEYVKGQNLRQLLNRQTSIDTRLALHIIRQVAAALYRAGQQGVVHRDIKPENIMLAPTGEVKVTDFGLARVTQNGDAMNLTQVGVTMGTPLYMSPEQVEGRALDQRSDLYSFGVTCYHMLAGRPPFQGETPLSIAVQHLKAEPDRLEELRPDLPPGLCRIVHTLMAKSPSQRFASAADVLRELRTLQTPEGSDELWSSDSLAAIELEVSGRDFTPTLATQQLQAVMHQTQTLAIAARRRFWPWVLLMVAGALAAGGLFAWSTRPPPLLANAGQPGTIARFANVKEQFAFAATSPVQSEAAYRAVWEYFPPTDGDEEHLYYARRAKQRLAQFYRDEDQIAKATEIYRELANLPDAELDFKIIGHLGLANIYTEQGNAEAATSSLSAARSLMQRIPQREDILLETLDKPIRDKWKQSLRETD